MKPSYYMSNLAFIVLFIFWAGNIFAYPVVEAESYTDMLGIQLENNNTDVGYFDAGDWLYYENVDFASGPAAIVISIAKLSSGGAIELHLDAIDGQLIGTFEPVSTNSWTVFEEQKCNIDKITGIHNLYLVATGISGVCNIDYFTFSDVGVYEPLWQLEWSDEFNGTEVDESVWTKVYHGNPDNGELQFYTPRPENI